MKEYIEREAAIAEFQKRLDIQGDAWISNRIDMAQRAMRVADIKIIRNIPAADVVEVRHGQWLDVTWCGEDYLSCSVCGNGALAHERTNFCPNCGAKMDEMDGGVNDGKD